MKTIREESTPAANARFLSRSLVNLRSFAVPLVAMILAFVPFQSGFAQTLADALDAPQLTWTTGGNQPWVGQTTVRHDGVDAARSGAIGNDQQSWLQTTVTGPGTLTFWWKVSSEAYSDILEFQVNGSPQPLEIFGEVDWRREIIELEAGSNTLRWRYYKDSSVAKGQDRAWVDTVRFIPPDGPPVILIDPLSRTAETGASATFEIEARGATPFSYQWFRGATLLPGAEDAALTLLNLSAADAGQYTVRVQNSLNSVTSAPALLTVIPPSLDPTFDLGTDGSITALAVQPDGKVVVGGSFTSLGGQPRANLGRLNPDGSLDPLFNPGANSSVTSLIIQPDGRILVGGNFSTLAGASRDGIGRLNADSSIDTAFVPVLDGIADTLVLQADGKILIAGGFTTVGGQPRINLARLNANGTLDTTFRRDITGAIWCLALQANGSILVGGSFSLDVGGDFYFSMVRLGSNGAVDEGFYPDPNGSIDCIAVQPDGRILVSGGFTVLDSGNSAFVCAGLGRIDGSGNPDTSFNPAPAGQVSSMVLQADGKIVLGGNFTSLAGQPRDSIGRLNANGTIDSTFAPSADGPVASLAMQGDGKILVGGNFTTLGGQPRYRLRRLNASTAPTQSLTYVGTTITWLRGGTSPEALRTTFEHSADGNTWTVLGAGSRVTGGWQRTGASVPAGNTIRARGYVIGGSFNSSGSIVESTRGKPSFQMPPFSRTNIYGTTATFAVSAAGSEPLSYQWLKNGAALSSQGNISGARTNTLTLSQVTKADDGGYRLVVTNSFGSVTSLVATLTVLDPVILQHPVGANRNSGEAVAFAVTAEGSPTLNYQWYQGAVPIAGATSPTLTLQDLTSADSGSYSVVVSNTAGSVTSSNAVLTVTTIVPLAEALDTPALTWNSGGNHAWSGQTDVTHDGVDSAQSGPITDSQESWLQTTVTGPSLLTFWWKVSSESDYDFLEFYINGILQTGRISGDVNWQLRSFELGAGIQTLRWRYIKDDVFRSNLDQAWVDTVQFSSIETSPPVIASHPQGQTVVVGADVTMSTTAIGAQPLAYQWFKGATAVADATNSSLALLNVQLSDTGFYSLVVTNAFGSDTSQLAYLNVVTPESAGANGIVGVLAVQPDGKLLVGGSFTSLRGHPRSDLGRLNPDGTVDATFTPGADGDVLALALQPDGKILVGGNFFNVAGTSRSRLARLNADGSLDNTFNPGASGGEVYSVVVQADGKVLVGGAFTTLAGQPRSHLGRLNADGTLDATFTPGASGDVLALALQPDGKILVGGAFATLAGQPRAFVGRLNANGAIDSTFNPGADAPVLTLAVQADGKILTGGFFLSLGGQPRERLARLNANGALDTTFSPVADAPVFSMALQTDGRILLGGAFTALAGQPRNRLGRLNGDGTLDGTFNPGMNDDVFCLAVQPTGKIVVGGKFTSAGGQTRNRLAELNNTGPVVQSLSFSGNTVTWLRGGPGPEVWRTTFESSVDGSAWSDLGEGTRIAGGWQKAGVALPANATLRARGNVAGDQFGSAWFVESYIYPNLPIHLNAVRAGGLLKLNWTDGPGYFQVQQTTNLTAPIIWQDFGAPVQSHLHSVPIGSNNTFWRVRRP